jgi:two-component system NtrC family sensor kinase
MNIRNISKLKRYFRLNFRARMIISFFTVIMFMGLCSIFIGLKIINDDIIRSAFDNVSNSLETTRQVYRHEIELRERVLSFTADTELFASAVVGQRRAGLHETLLRLKESFGFDIVNLCTPSGTVLVRVNNVSRFGDSLEHDEFVQYVIKNEEAVSGTGFISREDLLIESRELVKQSKIKVIPTPHASFRESRTITDAMAMKIAVPVMIEGKMVGIIYGAVILNRNNELVDSFRKSLFQDEMIGPHYVGTTTIFSGGVRIATNVTDNKGNRAIGTRISRKVYQHVIEEGKVWIKKAFVVNDWYLSGYTPIYDIHGEVIGSLYVGILEEKYNRIKRDAVIYLLAIILATGVIAAGFSTYLIVSLTGPAKELIRASKGVIDGNYRKVDFASSDEMGYLCHIYNRMIDAINERDRLLQENTEKTILQSEKMASLGRLASGIAHEINNPLTGILTYSSMLLEDLKDTEYNEDINIIKNETIRCRDIVRKILNFARETRMEREYCSINQIIIESVSIFERQYSFQNIKIEKKLDDNIPYMSLDVNQMKSIFSNLIINAADAMPSGGEICISTDYAYTLGLVVIRVRDSGTGIAEEDLNRVFDPFFTTKETGKGTGLGLSITYSSIRRHNGHVDIASTEGKGTEIIISLPVDQVSAESTDQEKLT